MDPRILVGVDGSSGSTRALEWALCEAEHRRTGVLALMAIGSPADFGESLFYRSDGAKAAVRANELLSSIILEVAGDRHAMDIRPLVVEGDAAGALCEHADGVDLVVVGSRGHGSLSGLLLGSVSMKLAHHCPVAVAIVPRHYRAAPVIGEHVGRIVVGVDGSLGARRALEWSANEASLRGFSLEAVAIWPRREDEGLASANFPIHRDGAQQAERTDRIEQDFTSVAERFSDAKMELVFLEGDPSETLCRESATADLLVVGARGHGVFADLLLGSVSSKCIHRSLRPIVIVPDQRVRRRNDAEADLTAVR